MTPPRTIVIIGATSGLGRHAARQLGAAGNRLVLVGRDRRRAEELRAELPAADVITSDVATLDGAETVAKRVGDAVGAVDTLVNNAGVIVPDRRTTSEDMELNLAVHHLAPYSMTSLLLPLLRAGDGRIVNVNSEGHRAALFRSGPIELDVTDLNSERGYDPFLVYSRTKLANLMFTYELHRRYPELTAVAVHPGMVRTDLGREFPRLQVAAMHAISMSARKGAAPVVALATEPGIAGGTYYDRSTPTRSSPASYDRDTAGRLWAETERLRGPFGP
ncbi:MAG TPA: SDR family NAD(P)-dependent oxidoreductase [Streptosporangiaceae bacterium]|jgi:NAD(P)-dependent dehydrogenase (short-subunit alcohol dehydrogenase family)